MPQEEVIETLAQLWDLILNPEHYTERTNVSPTMRRYVEAALATIEVMAEQLR
jgi:hypothetical protein